MDNVIIEEVLLNDKEISAIIKKLSDDIINYYNNTKKVTILVLMDGCYNFSEELKKLLPAKFFFKYIKVLQREEDSMGYI